MEENQQLPVVTVSAKKASRRSKATQVKGSAMKPQAPREAEFLKRKRNKVDRYKPPCEKKIRSCGIPPGPGRGTKLEDIPKVKSNLTKGQHAVYLQHIHKLLYGEFAKARNLRKKIGQYSGLIYTDALDEERYRTIIRGRIDAITKEMLLEIFKIFDLAFNAKVTKDVLLEQMLEFLVSPHPRSQGEAIEPVNTS